MADVRRPWGAVGLVAAALLVAAVVPLPGPTGVGTDGLPIDWLLHAVGYGILAAALGRALLADGQRWLPALGLAVGLSLGYGFGLELVQLAVPTRSFSVADLVADATGALVGTGVLALGGRFGAR